MKTILFCMTLVIGFSVSAAALEDGKTPTNYEKGQTAAGECPTCIDNSTGGLLTDKPAHRIQARVAALLGGSSDNSQGQKSNTNQ